MVKYKIRIKASALKELNKIPKKDLKRITVKIENMAKDSRPVGVEKLSGQELYRIRQGNYRIVYSIRDDILTIYVVKISHRKDVYR